MIVGKQNIIAWFESLNVPFWVLFAKGTVDKGNPIGQNSEKKKDADSASVNITDSLEELKRLLDLQNRGQFTLIAADKPNVTVRGGFRADFEIPSSEANTAAPILAPNIGIGGMPQSIGELDDLTTKRAAQMVENVKLEMKLQKALDENAELKKENKELEKESAKGINRFWDAINGIGVDKIISAFMTKAPVPQVTGIQETAAPPENDVEYANRIGNVLRIFQENDPDWIDTLERMAYKIQADPSVIKMFKKFL